MSNQHSIALHLATVMGLNPKVHNTTRAGDVICIVGNVFNPFANRAQWADVILWAVERGSDGQNTAHLVDYGAFAPSLSVKDSIAHAMLEAIALATGWKE